MKLHYRLTRDNRVEWRAVGDDEKPLGPWRKTQAEAGRDFVQLMDDKEEHGGD